MTENAVALPDAPLISSDLIMEIAMDIGKEVAAHIETMYPRAVDATSPNILVSVRNKVYNEIVAALETIEIRARLQQRREVRRRQLARGETSRGGESGSMS